MKTNMKTPAVAEIYQQKLYVSVYLGCIKPTSGNYKKSERNVRIN